MIEHGYRHAPGEIELEGSVDAEAIVVRIRDAAPPFDPRSAPEPRLDLPLAHRPFGGMGIHLARTLTDGMDHRILPGGGNEVTVTKRLRPAADGPRGRATMDITTERPSADLAVIALSRRARRLELRAGDRGRPDRRSPVAPPHVVLDLGGLTYMGSSGLVAIHSIALLARGREPISPDDGWQAIHDIGSEAADEGAADAVPRRARPVRRPCPRAQRDGEPVPRPRRPGRRDRRRLGLTAPAPAVAHASLDRLLDAAAIQQLLDAAARLIPGGSIDVEDTDGAVVAAAGGERRETAAAVRSEIVSEMRRPIAAAGEPVGAVVVNGSVADRAALDAVASTVAAALTLAATEAAGRRAVSAAALVDLRELSLLSRLAETIGSAVDPDRIAGSVLDVIARPLRAEVAAVLPAGGSRPARVDRRRGRRGPAGDRGRLDRGAPPIRRSRPGCLRRPREPGPTGAFGSILAAVVRTTRGPQGAIVLGRHREAPGHSTTRTGGSSRRSPARPRSPSSERRCSASSWAGAASTRSSRSAGASSAR